MKTLTIFLLLLAAAPVYADHHVISYESLQRDQERARERQERGPTYQEQSDARLQELQNQVDRQRAEMQAEQGRQQSEQQQQQIRENIQRGWR